MRLNLYSVFDVKGGIYLSPFVGRSDVDAIRMVRGSFDNPEIKNSPVGQNPEDYALTMVGGFDDESGMVGSVDGPPTVVMMLSDIRTGST